MNYYFTGHMLLFRSKLLLNIATYITLTLHQLHAFYVNVISFLNPIIQFQ